MVNFAIVITRPCTGKQKLRALCATRASASNISTQTTPLSFPVIAALCVNKNMNQKIKARIIGANGNDALSLEWLGDSKTDGSVTIGGPAVTQIPLVLVPKELRLPNTIIYVSLSDPYTIVKVERYVSNT